MFFLLIMIDYFIEKPINLRVLGRIYEAFLADDGVDSVTLSNQDARLKKSKVVNLSVRWFHLQDL